MRSLRPLVGIRSCLAGNRVRYDGTDREDDRLLAQLEYFADLVPLCPEVAIGLGVPRAPIQLTVLEDGRLRVRGVADASLDVTDDLRAYAESQLPLLEQLDGYVFKARSPSCGTHAVLRVHADGSEDEQGRGYFADFVRRRFPLMPLADERVLADTHSMARFERYVKAYHSRYHPGEERYGYRAGGLWPDRDRG